MYLLGYDIGSSFIKASIIDIETGKLVAAASAPSAEMPMIAHKPGWAEQEPAMWWENAKDATRQLTQKANLKEVKAIGISYQMHGLVAVDRNHEVLRPSIIWCDSRAVEIGDTAFAQLGKENALTHLFNSPGNFTASKLRWVQQNEPQVYERIHKFMLPGDYLALCLTGEATTTASGLSEGILWDFQNERPADLLLDLYGISPSLIPTIVPTFAPQGYVTSKIADELGFTAGIPVSYRAGDQPNNALSLNVLEPGEIAATAGTSGVVYGITDQKEYDSASRVNSFLHVNHTSQLPRYGTLLCINGTGILNSWLRKNTASGLTYDQINQLAASVPVGSDGLVTLPFGNGAERVLENKLVGASVQNLNFNNHTQAHLLRSAQEGIVFALNYGVDVMKTLGVKPRIVRAGDANMFLSPLFGEAFSTITGAVVELYNTDGAQGAARAAGVGAGIYKSYREACQSLKTTRIIEPNVALKDAYEQAYLQWLKALERMLH
ncbi:FGGY family carbohydrate kinase [Cytophagaceae bacterium YF14B1]|uniref:FGGY family carbohydrate kinase n=1 Tax=Xanthocytophaga flava TaxID=3048013 RepID=A0AAE3QNC8_9BACT|nr:FGGY family carbohydrate kinase [Xanthocytophaga flavus]MDJ1479768.1 FGGY family carbohydrate kinase [Xanthocytophaga flavus]